jgi:hypothetical protein
MSAATRQRRERFISEHDSQFSGEFDKALFACMRAAGGLAFFTDKQIEQIAAEMVRRERQSHSMAVRCRRSWVKGEAA